MSLFQKHYLHYIYTDIHRVYYIKTLAPHSNILTETLKEKFLVAQMVKILPAMWESWVQSLGRSPGEGNGYQLSILA